MKTVGIAGYSGYSGAELVRLLGRHPHLQPILLDHRSEAGGDMPIRGSHGPRHLPCDADSVRTEGLAGVFLATPPEVSMELAPAMLQAGCRVVDLSGAFRLRTPENYAAWYGAPHSQPELLA